MTEPTTCPVDLLVFEAAGHHLATPLVAVARITRIGAGDRGGLDLGTMLGGRPSSDHPDARALVFADRRATRVLVDAVHDVIGVTRVALHRFPDYLTRRLRLPWIWGVAEKPDQQLLVLVEPYRIAPVPIHPDHP